VGNKRTSYLLWQPHPKDAGIVFLWNIRKHIMTDCQHCCEDLQPCTRCTVFSHHMYMNLTNSNDKLSVQQFLQLCYPGVTLLNSYGSWNALYKHSSYISLHALLPTCFINLLQTQEMTNFTFKYIYYSIWIFKHGIKWRTGAQVGQLDCSITIQSLQNQNVRIHTNNISQLSEHFKDV